MDSPERVKSLVFQPVGALCIRSHEETGPAVEEEEEEDEEEEAQALRPAHSHENSKPGLHR